MALTQISTGGIKDDAVTLAKQAAGTDGQIITYDASGNPVAVGPGTDGQVLTSTGAGSPPAFETLPTSGAALTGSTNNTITTVTGANAIQGEANLTYDGTDLKITTDANGEGIVMYSSGSTFSKLSGDANRASENQSCLNIQANWDGTAIAAIDFVAGADTTNKDDGKIRFQTTTSGSNIAERMRIESDGNVKILDGDLLIGTDGHGIDFGATSDASGATSEKLDDYEEGTWTPGVGTTSGTNVTGVYTKIGRLVHVRAFVGWGSHSNTGTNAVIITGLPFTPGHTGYGYLGDSRYINLDSNMNGIGIFFNSDGVNFRENGDNTAADHLLWSQLGNDTYFGFSGTYFV